MEIPQSTTSQKTSFWDFKSKSLLDKLRDFFAGFFLALIITFISYFAFLFLITFLVFGIFSHFELVKNILFTVGPYLTFIPIIAVFVHMAIKKRWWFCFGIVAGLFICLWIDTHLLNFNT